MIAAVVAIAPRSASAQAFSSVAGFSTTQGANQWSYLDSENVAMTSGNIYAGGVGDWHSPTPSTWPAGDWCYISSTQQHPGSTKDSIRRWTAPTTGTIRITGNSRMTGYNGGDGTLVFIRKNETWLFAAVVPANDVKIGKSWALTSIPVMAGDVIDTVVNRYGTYNGDEQLISQTIEYTPQPAPFNSAAGFGTTQGANQWSYLASDGTSVGTPMVFGTTYAGGAWQSTAAGGPDWCYVSRTQQHPGTSTTAIDSIRRWTAPQSGVVSIIGSSRMSGYNGGDGAHVLIRRNGLQLFGGFVPANDTTTGTTWSLTSEVLAGDVIDTVVNRGQTYSGDEQILSQTITYDNPQIIAAPASGYALRLSTVDLPGPQLDATRVVNSALVDLASPVASADRFVPANPTKIVAYVASNVAPAEQPRRITVTGTVRKACEGLRGAAGQPGTYTETITPILQDTTAVVAQGALSKSFTIYPNDYTCAQGVLLRNLVIEVQATARKANGTVIATTPVARVTLVARIKMMSWNIRGGINVGAAQTATTLGSIAALIASEKVDVAVLQEVHVNFNADSGFLDEMAILRNTLAPAGLTSDHYQPRCDRGQLPLSADGMAIFSKFPRRSVAFQQLGTQTGHCAGGPFNTYVQKFGIETMTVAFGGGSMVLGNTHMPSQGPDGYPSTLAGWLMAANDFGAANATAMDVSPYSFLMGGDYNAGPGGGAFVGIMSKPLTVKLVDVGVPSGIYTVRIPFPNYDYIDHMFYKSAAIVASPVESYFAHWDDTSPIGVFNPALSDHVPRLTIYDVK